MRLWGRTGNCESKTTESKGNTLNFGREEPHRFARSWTQIKPGFLRRKKIPITTFLNVLLEAAKWMAAFILGAAGAAVQVPWLSLTSAIFEE